MRKALLPWDVRNECLWIVRGYRRRLMEYQNDEDCPATKRMRAVEKAKLGIGRDIGNFEMRLKLIDAIMLSCEDGKKYPFRMLCVDGISERDFYRRRDLFLLDIAKELSIV